MTPLPQTVPCRVCGQWIVLTRKADPDRPKGFRCARCAARERAAKKGQR
jgi:hypothetical protein